MPKLSQNSKIALGTMAVFMVSVSVMMFLLGQNGEGVNPHMAASVMHSSDSHVEDSQGQSDPDQNEELYKSYFNQEAEMILVINSEGEFEYICDRICEKIDLNCKSLEKSHFFDYLNENDLVEYITIHTKLIQNPQNMDGVGPFRLKNNDKEIFALFSIRPVTDDEEKVEKLIFSIKDITEQIEEMTKEQEKQEYLRKIEDAGRLMVDKIS